MKFPLILADPPWAYHGGGAATRYLAKQQYPTMSVDEIAALPVSDVAADDSILLLWCTWPKLPQGLHVMQEWGFQYTTGFPWVKTNLRAGNVRLGPGYHVRQVSEFLLIGVRGAARAPEPALRLPGLIQAPCTGHSRKPGRQYDFAERYPGPYLELFHINRDGGLFPPREDWTFLGHGATGNDIADDLRQLAATQSTK